MNINNSKSRVKDANRSLYDALRDNYEKVDGRRRDELLSWLRNRMKNAADLSGGKNRLLDIGCGSGFALRAAEGIFKRSYGVDISHNILKNVSQFADGVICADSDYIPFVCDSIDAMVLFAVLHHFYDYKDTMKEIYRVLRRGGILYVDHDMSKDFASRFRFLLWIYRKIKRKKIEFMLTGVEGELYELSEVHSDGVDSIGFVNYLRELGFMIIKESYHWYGLNKFTDSIFKQREYRRGNAPLMSIIAKKV